MSSKEVSIFKTNPRKDFIRSGFDKKIIRAWYDSKKTGLKYLGLPGADMLDIIEWQDYLSEFTTIEREENQQHLMYVKAHVKDFEHRLLSLYGDFDEILLSGRDRYSKLPDWPYDIINFDYYGGLLYPGTKRPQAIKKLVQNQSAHKRGFVLFITQHVRDRDIERKKMQSLNELGATLKNGILEAALHPQIDHVIDWYRDASIPDVARQTLYMNYFLRDVGESEYFNVKCNPGILYEGTGGAWMIHFATEFNYLGGAIRGVSSQSLVAVVNLGLMDAGERELLPSRFQQPKLEFIK